MYTLYLHYPIQYIYPIHRSMTIQRNHFSARQFSGDISAQDKSARTTFTRRQVSASCLLKYTKFIKHNKYGKIPNKNHIKHIIKYC